MLGTATITLIVVSLMLLSDTIIEGNFVGEHGIAGINLVLPIYIAINFFATMIGVGTVLLIYEARGKFNNQRANQYFSQSIILALACGLVAMAWMIFFKNAFLDMMHVSIAVRREAEAYWKYEQFVALLAPINYLLIELVYADGDELVTTVANLTQVLGNILLSIVLCKTIGTEGVSLGTLIGTFLATGILSIHFFRKSNTYRFRWYVSFRDIKKMLYLSTVDAVVYLCWTLLSFGLNLFVVFRFHDGYLPIVSMVINLFELTLFFDGIGEALSPIEEIYLSEGNRKNAKFMARYSCKVAIIEGLCITIGLCLFSKYIPHIYNIETPELQTLAVLVVRILAPVFPFVAVLYMLTSQYLLVRHIRLASVGALIGHVALYLLLGCGMGTLFGFTAMWVGMSLAPPVSVLLILLFVRFFYGKAYFPWLIEPDTYPYENHSFYLEEQNLLQVRDQIARFLENYPATDSLINRVMLVIEETGLCILKKNADKSVIMEITVAVKEGGIQLIFRDTGESFDITNTDNQVTDFSSYVTSLLYDSYEEKKYLLTIQYNRNMLFIPFK